MPTEIYKFLLDMVHGFCVLPAMGAEAESFMVEIDRRIALIERRSSHA